MISIDPKNLPSHLMSSYALLFFCYFFCCCLYVFLFNVATFPWDYIFLYSRRCMLFEHFDGVLL